MIQTAKNNQRLNSKALAKWFGLVPEKSSSGIVDHGWQYMLKDEVYCSLDSWKPQINAQQQHDLEEHLVKQILIDYSTHGYVMVKTAANPNSNTVPFYTAYSLDDSIIVTGYGKNLLEAKYNAILNYVEPEEKLVGRPRGKKDFFQGKSVHQLDYKFLKKNYTRAWSHLEQWLIKRHKLVYNSDHHQFFSVEGAPIDIGPLLTYFFEANGIRIILIHHDESEMLPDYWEYLFYNVKNTAHGRRDFLIYMEDKACMQTPQSQGTRTSAEAAAFRCGLRILGLKLYKETGSDTLTLSEDIKGTDKMYETGEK